MKSLKSSSTQGTSSMADRSRSRGDEVLLRLVAQKDQAAYEELFTRYIKRAFALASNLIHNRELAEEAAQETMLAVWRSAPSFDPDRGPAQGWIFQIIANKSVQISRKELRDRVRENSDKATVSKSSMASEQSIPEIEQCEIKKHLRILLANLPLESRQLVTLYFGANLSQDQIAKRTSISQRNISTQLKTILEKLKADLTKGGFATPAALNALIHQNLWSGWQLPETFSRNMFDRIISHTQAKSESAVAKGTSNRPNLVIFTIALILLGALSIAIFHYQESNSQNDIDLESLSASVESRPSVAPEEPTKRWRKTWDFNTTDSTDGLTFENESPIYKPTSGWQDSGCLSFQIATGKPKIQLAERHLPLKISCQMKPGAFVENQTLSAAVTWSDFQCPSVYAIFEDTFNLKNAQQMEWTTFTFYIQSQAVDLWTHSPSSNTPKRGSVLLLHLLDDVAFSLTVLPDVKVEIDNLSVEEVSREEIPDVSAFIAAFEKRKSNLKSGEPVSVQELSTYQNTSTPITLTKLNYRTSGDGLLYQKR